MGGGSSIQKQAGGQHQTAESSINAAGGRLRNSRDFQKIREINEARSPEN
jgi:hypothetical protein